ncbi:MAG: OadG family protein [Clostridia bacterium]|nr:OadG family protein [Clostridia bacterium]MBN2883795.1 OadG family protein [Clostridia bacterium]
MWLQSIVGISVVFLALIALSFFIYLFGKVMVNGSTRKKTSDDALKEIKNIEVSADTDDAELIAVITAAIQASLKKAGITPECKIVVKSFKRIESDSPVWNTTGRKEVLN